MQLFRRITCALILLGLLAGCQTHVVAPMGADMSVFGMPPDENTRRAQTDYEIEKTLELAPLARFPATIAIVRVQSAASASRSHGVSYGSGAYQIELTPTVETDAHLRQVDRLNQVHGAVRLNRLVIGERCRTNKDLRAAAARLHADLLLVYTINTEWAIDNDAEPLDAITFGFSKYKNVTVTSTATALLLGTHNGYIYATAEVARDKRYKDNAWRNSEQIEEAKETLEQQAFDGLVESFVKAWPGVVDAYAGGREAKR